MATGSALIMGVNEVDPNGYDGKWDGKLNFCEGDARSVAELAETAGFANTLLLTDQVTKSALLEGAREAAGALAAGDIFLFYFSGHGNTTDDLTADEKHQGNARDETLCLYDNQILDDELYTLWQEFEPGVRILVLTDACHSGSVLRSRENDLTPKAVDAETRDIMKRMNPTMYSDVRGALAPPQPVRASLLHLAGCREDQLSYESRRLEHGQFTAAMLNALKAGKDDGFSGSYKALFAAMEQAMPADQKPVMNALGVSSERFNTEPAFTVG